MPLTKAERSRINTANGTRSLSDFWNTRRTHMLTVLWPMHFYAAQIAELIGDGCTKGMVIGKANRLKLKAKQPHNHSRAA